MFKIKLLREVLIQSTIAVSLLVLRQTLEIHLNYVSCCATCVGREREKKDSKREKESKKEIKFK